MSILQLVGMAPSWFKSNVKSGWPFQFSLNQLTPKLRSKKTILGGLWFGSGKPKSHIVIKSLVEELEILYTEGITWTHLDGTVRNTKIVPLCCCVDSPARACMMECKQYNGKYGCPYCYNPGRRVNDPTSDDDKKGGWKYPFSVSEEDAQNNPEDIIELYEGRTVRKDCRERTEEEVLNHMMQAAENQLDVTIKEKDKTVKGFSGLTSMSAIIPSLTFYGDFLPIHCIYCRVFFKEFFFL